MSAKILAALLPDIPDMDTLVRRAYQGKFETEDLTPTVSVGGYSVLELFRGPTSAFKDVALSMLPQLLTAAKNRQGDGKGYPDPHRHLRRHRQGRSGGLPGRARACASAYFTPTAASLRCSVPRW